MHIKRFEGKSLPALLEQIRGELGEDALILETRTVARGRIEVLAARPHAGDVTAAARESAPEVSPLRPSVAGGMQAYAREGSTASRVAAILAKLPKTESTERDRTATSVGEATWALANAEAPAPIRSESLVRPDREDGERARADYLGRLVRSEHFSVIPLPLRELYLDLVDAEIDSNLVFQILSKMGHAPMPGQFATAPPDQLLALLSKLVRVGGTIEEGPFPKVMALVGPTGVGKTTTVAKIAGLAAFHLRKRVALVSTDSYRVFGSQHLASYAALMGLPFTNVTEAKSIRGVIDERSRDCDLVLIDTSGRSPRDPLGIAEIQRLLSACPELDIHLVLAANSRVRDQALALERFSVLPIQHLIFTKLDETTRRGGLFTVALKAKRPVSYLGTGQEVPDDLEVASVAALTEPIGETLDKESLHA